MEDELGLIGASAEDTEAELIRKICETELLAGNKNLLCFVSCCTWSTFETLFTRFYSVIIFLLNVFSSPLLSSLVCSEENLLCAFLPLLVKVCSSPGRYSHPQLTTAACLALSQFMMIR